MRAGVDLGGTKIDVLVVEGERDVRGRARRPTPTEGGAVAVVEAIARAVEEAADAAAVDVDQLTGVGVGSPGAVDPSAGTVGFNSNLAGGWTDPYPFAEELARRHRDSACGWRTTSTSPRPRSSSSARAATCHPFSPSGGGPGSADASCSPVGDGKATAASGELGHTVVKLGGRICPCGRRGCVEAYAGRAAMEARARHLHERGQHTKLFDLMRKANRDRLTSGVWERALKEHDALARELIDDAYDAIGAACASVVNLLDIDGIVLGGGLGTRFGATGPSASARRCARTSSTRPAILPSGPPSWVTTAARSAPRCSSGRAFGAVATRAHAAADPGLPASRRQSRRATPEELEVAATGGVGRAAGQHAASRAPLAARADQGCRAVDVGGSLARPALGAALQHLRRPEARLRAVLPRQAPGQRQGP